MNNHTIDVLIIGAGPAGLSAAIACRKKQLNVVIVDEFMKPGGRLLGQLHQEPNGEWWNGIEESKRLTDEAKALGVSLLCGVSVYHIEKLDEGFRVHTNNGEWQAANLLLATGAAESPAPIPGWTLPGVMSIGAAQVMTNVHRVKVGKKGIVIGINVLSAAIAREMQLAGIKLHSLALPAMNAITTDAGHPHKVMDAMARVAHLAPSALIRMGSKLAQIAAIRNLALRFYPPMGMKMWGIPIHLRRAVIEINGTDQVESVTMCKVSPEGKIIAGSEQIIPVDFVCIAGGLYPLAELAAVIGCPFQYVEELGGHIPVHNERMETLIDGLFVAGNITGIESAKVAEAQGTLAGYSIIKRMRPHDDNIEKEVKTNVAHVTSVREQATIQFHPGIAIGRQLVAQKYEELKSSFTS